MDGETQKFASKDTKGSSECSSVKEIHSSLSEKIDEYFTHLLSCDEAKTFLAHDNFTSILELSKTLYNLKHHSSLSRKYELPHSPGEFASAIFDSLTLRRATPKNLFWYKRNYAFAGYESADGNLCDCASKTDIVGKLTSFEGKNTTVKYSSKEYEKFCMNCVNGQIPPLILPNSNDQCVNNLIDLFLQQSNQAFDSQDMENSRFILYGNAGEGKTAFINYLLSVKQDLMWEKKLFTVKVNITDDDIKDRFSKLKNQETKELDFIQKAVELKLVRLFVRFYKTAETSVCVESDLGPFIPQEMKTSLRCQLAVRREDLTNMTTGRHDITRLQDGRSEYVYYLTYSDGKMSDAFRDRLLAASEDHVWSDAVGKLYNKSQSTLSRNEVDAIVSEITSTIERNYGPVQASKILKRDLVPFGRERLLDEPVDPLVASTIRNELWKRGFRFLVIFEGFDPHHNLGKDEGTITQLLVAAKRFVMRPNANNFYASYLLIIRAETIRRIMLRETAAGIPWGGVHYIKLAPVSFEHILYKRLQSMMERSPNMPYYKTFFPYFIQLTSAHVKKCLTGKEIALDSRCLFEDLQKLYRNNNRKLLLFYYLYVKEIFHTLNKKDSIRSLAGPPSEKECLDIATSYWETLKNISYPFWNAVLYRDKVMYEDFITAIGLCANDKTIVEWEHSQASNKASYGTIPNLFCFIKLDLRREENSGQKFLVRNKSLLKIRMLQYLHCKRVAEYRHLLHMFAEIYDLSPNEVHWEIDSLLMMGFIKYDIRDSIANSRVGERINPKIQVTDFWSIYFNNMFKKDPFVGLMSAMDIPNESPLTILHDFVPFTVINSNLIKGELENRWANAFASEIVVITLMSHYIRFLERLEHKDLRHRVKFDEFLDSFSIGFPYDKIKIGERAMDVLKGYSYGGIDKSPLVIRDKVSQLLERYSGKIDETFRMLVKRRREEET